MIESSREYHLDLSTPNAAKSELYVHVDLDPSDGRPFGIGHGLDDLAWLTPAEFNALASVIERARKDRYDV